VATQPYCTCLATASIGVQYHLMHYAGLSMDDDAVPSMLIYYYDLLLHRRG
jgi:hypothetical protein